MCGHFGQSWKPTFFLVQSVAPFLSLCWVPDGFIKLVTADLQGSTHRLEKPGHSPWKPWAVYAKVLSPLTPQEPWGSR